MTTGKRKHNKRSDMLADIVARSDNWRDTHRRMYLGLETFPLTNSSRAARDRMVLVEKLRQLGVVDEERG